MPDPMVQEWLKLLELTTDYMVAAEAVINGLMGRLEVATREEAAVVIEQRVRDYQAAKRAMMEHAKSREAMLSG